MIAMRVLRALKFGQCFEVDSGEDNDKPVAVEVALAVALAAEGLCWQRAVEYENKNKIYKKKKRYNGN